MPGFGGLHRVDRERTDGVDAEPVELRRVVRGRALVRRLPWKKVKVVYVPATLTVTGQDTPLVPLLLAAMGAVADFDLARILERQREGITLARKAGIYKGRGKALNPGQAAALIRRAAAGEAKASLAREFGVSRQTVYHYLQPGPP